jgi:maltooligosyltrehalose synthase
VDAVERLVQRVSIEQDDILATLQLVRGDDVLEERLFEQLVDLLVEGMFLELRQQHLDGAITPEAYIDELRTLAAMCRGVGLLPLPSSDA